MTTETPLQIGTPTLRWTAKAQSIADIETELARIWATQDLTVESNGETIRRVGARTSVMNLVVVARRPELAEHCAATVQALTGRHPSRTIVIQSADPDGPSWFDARIEAHCVLPRADAAEICAETIHVIAGGEAGQHLAAIATPLVIHDLPVTVWWPGEPLLTSPAARELLAGADRLVVDGSAWSGDGLRRIHDLAMLVDTTRLGINDFALVRQARWREAIASTFDDPDFLPYLGSLRRIAITYGTHDDTGALGSTNLVKPLYHVAWLAARLGLTVETPLAPAAVSARAAKAAKASGQGGPDDEPRAGGDPPQRPVRGGRRDATGGLPHPGRDDPARRAPGRTTRLGTADRHHRRGRHGPRPRLAGRRRSAGPAVPRATAQRSGPARRRDRVGPARCRRCRDAPIGRGAGRTSRRKQVNEPETIVVADREAGAAEAADPDRDDPGRRCRRARTSRLGDDRGLDARGDLPAPRRAAARGHRPVAIAPRMVGR